MPEQPLFDGRGLDSPFRDMLVHPRGRREGRRIREVWAYYLVVWRLAVGIACRLSSAFLIKGACDAHDHANCTAISKVRCLTDVSKLRVESGARARNMRAGKRIN